MRRYNLQSHGGHERSFGLVALLDPLSEATIRGLWHELELAGITASLPSIVCAQPHITLGTFTDVCKSLLHDLPALASACRPFGIAFSSIGVFTGHNGATVFLQPTVTRELLELQRGMRKLMQRLHLPLHPFYEAERWHPHCSLGVGLPRPTATRAFEYCLDLELPLWGQVRSLALLEMIRHAGQVISGCQQARWELVSGKRLPTIPCPHPAECLFEQARTIDWLNLS